MNTLEENLKKSIIDFFPDKANNKNHITYNDTESIEDFEKKQYSKDTSHVRNSEEREKSRMIPRISKPKYSQAKGEHGEMKHYCEWEKLKMEKDTLIKRIQNMEVNNDWSNAEKKAYAFILVAATIAKDLNTDIIKSKDIYRHSLFRETITKLNPVTDLNKYLNERGMYGDIRGFENKKFHYEALGFSAPVLEKFKSGLFKFKYKPDVVSIPEKKESEPVFTEDFVQEVEASPSDQVEPTFTEDSIQEVEASPSNQVEPKLTSQEKPTTQITYLNINFNFYSK